MQAPLKGHADVHGTEPWQLSWTLILCLPWHTPWDLSTAVAVQELWGYISQGPAGASVGCMAGGGGVGDRIAAFEKIMKCGPRKTLSDSSSDVPALCSLICDN